MFFKPQQRTKIHGRRFDKLKSLLAFLQKIFTFRNIAIAIIIFIGYHFLNSSIFYVNDIKISSIKNQKFIKESEVFACTKKFLGKNIFNVQLSEVITSIQDCTVLVRNVSVNKILPSQIDVSIEEIQPVLKFSIKDNCYLVDNRTLIKKLALIDCSNYAVPELKNVPQADNPFLFTSVVKILDASDQAKLEKPTSFELITVGNTQFIRAIYKDFTVLYSPNLPADTYVTQYANTLKGLTEKGESFNEIDLRFDRVIVR